MDHCPQCGNTLSGDENFCTSCGEALASAGYQVAQHGLAAAPPPSSKGRNLHPAAAITIGALGAAVLGLLGWIARDQFMPQAATPVTIASSAPTGPAPAPNYAEQNGPSPSDLNPKPVGPDEWASADDSLPKNLEVLRPSYEIRSYVILGSFPDSVGAPKAFVDKLRRCLGFSPNYTTSGMFEGFQTGYQIAVLGGFSPQEAEIVRRKASRCSPTTYVKRGRWLAD